jgi:hypothetical protein
MRVPGSVADAEVFAGLRCLRCFPPAPTRATPPPPRGQKRWQPADIKPRKPRTPAYPAVRGSGVRAATPQTTARVSPTATPAVDAVHVRYRDLPSVATALFSHKTIRSHFIEEFGMLTAGRVRHITSASSWRPETAENRIGALHLYEDPQKLSHFNHGRKSCIDVACSH